MRSLQYPPNKLREGCWACAKNAENLSVAADHLMDKYPAYALSLILIGFQELGKVWLLLTAYANWRNKGAKETYISVPGFYDHKTKMEGFAKLAEEFAQLDKMLWAGLERQLEQLVGWQNEQKPLLLSFDHDERMYETDAYKKLMARIDESGETIRQTTLYVDFDKTNNVWSSLCGVTLDNALKERLELCQRRLFKCALNVQSLLDPVLIQKVERKAKVGGATWRINVRSRTDDIKLKIKIQCAKLRAKLHMLSNALLND